MRSLIRGGEGLTLAALLLFFGALFVFPLALLAQVALADGLAPIMEALESRSVRRALWSSLESAGLSACLALVAGTTAALILGLTDVRAKGVFAFLLLIIGMRR
ncbi:MAG: iron ABC transporter permease, partial [Pseudomonadota bacterium]